MDLQTRKLRLIERFMRIDNIELLSRVEELLILAEQEELAQNTPDITEEQAAELDRRYQEYKKNPESARPWDEVKAKLMAKYGYDG